MLFGFHSHLRLVVKTLTHKDSFDSIHPRRTINTPIRIQTFISKRSKCQQYISENLILLYYEFFTKMLTSFSIPQLGSFRNVILMWSYNFSHVYICIRNDVFFRGYRLPWLLNNSLHGNRTLFHIKNKCIDSVGISAIFLSKLHRSLCFENYQRLTFEFWKRRRCSGIDKRKGQVFQSCFKISVDLQHQAEP